MTYSLVNAPFLLAAALVAVAAVVLFRVRRSAERGSGAPVLRNVAVTLAGVLLLTAIFDNVIVGAGIVAYDPEHISGVLIGLAPIEDFAYAVVAAVALPALWLLLPGRDAGRPGERDR